MDSFYTHLNETNNAASLITSSIVLWRLKRNYHHVVGPLPRLHQAIPPIDPRRHNSLSTLTLTYVMPLALQGLDNTDEEDKLEIHPALGRQIG